ncbi:hypothetical protein [Aquimarina algiphila]|uniref:hypothetical protein n=1 Tax=Aquimarina algiphila TaxID=2047982 RepID=UPI00249089BF|nr:hypothetical protein [Aquimarina algiphila]
MIPYDFILEALYPLQLRHHRMFGVDAFYYGEKIVFALCEKEENRHDNGVWIATKMKYHEELRKHIKDVRIIKNFGPKTWMLLPADSDYFEEGCNLIAELIKSNSSLIGNVPKPKNK